jgi:hypothetical protein
MASLKFQLSNGHITIRGLTPIDFLWHAVSAGRIECFRADAARKQAGLNVEITARNLERAQAEFFDIETSSTRESLTVQLTFGEEPGGAHGRVTRRRALVGRV